jgi:hypothetical protein
MAGLQALSVVDGQIEAAGDRRIEAKFVNFGPILPILAQDTITITQTLHFIVKNGNTDVRTILGGEEGDLLVLLGDGTKFKKGGNVGESFDATPSPTFLIFDGAVWNV